MTVFNPISLAAGVVMKYNTVVGTSCLCSVGGEAQPVHLGEGRAECANVAPLPSPPLPQPLPQLTSVFRGRLLRPLLYLNSCLLFSVRFYVLCVWVCV